jgi:hypothetical protein
MTSIMLPFDVECAETEWLQAEAAKPPSYPIMHPRPSMQQLQSERDASLQSELATLFSTPVPSSSKRPRSPSIEEVDELESPPVSQPAKRVRTQVSALLVRLLLIFYLKYLVSSFVWTPSMTIPCFRNPRSSHRRRRRRIPRLSLLPTRCPWYLKLSFRNLRRSRTRLQLSGLLRRRLRLPRLSLATQYVLIFYSLPVLY